MLKTYDAGLSLFNETIDYRVRKWCTEARASLVNDVIPEMANIKTFLSIDKTSIPGYDIGIVGLCKSAKGLVLDCEFAITFKNTVDDSTFIVEMSTTKGYNDQFGFSDKLDVYNTHKWIKFVTTILESYKPNKANTIALSGTIFINKE